MTRRALPLANVRMRWLFASAHVTLGVIYLLYQLEPMQRGASGPRWPFQDIGSLDGRWIALLLGGVALVNVRLIDGLLEQRTLQDGCTRPALRAGRFLAAGIPLVGAYVLPIWLEILDRKPAWALAPLSSAPPPRQQRFLIFSSRTQWLRLSVPFFIWMLVIDPFLSGVGLAWLGARRTALFGMPLIDSATWMLHFLALASALVFVVAQRSTALRVPRPIPWLLPFLWLLPFPGCLLGALVVVIFDPFRKSRSIVRLAFGGRQMVGSQLIELGQMDWWKLSRWQRLRWPSGRSPADPVEAERQLLGLYRIKTFLLFPEAALLTAALVALSMRVPLSQILIHPLLMVVQLGALVLALLGSLMVARSLLCSRPDSSSPLDLTGRSLLFSGLALLAGLFAGAALGHGQAAPLAKLLLNVGYAGMITAGLLAPPIRFGASKIRHRPFPLIVWLLVFAVIGLSGARLASVGDANPQAMTFVLAVSCLAPLASISIGALSFPWLLHLFTPRHLVDRNLPSRLRLALAFLTATALAPGGGLAIPLWAAARRRLWRNTVRPQPQATTATPSPASGVSRLATLPAPQRRYLIHHAIAHQVANGATEILFQRIERHPFFAEQATCSGGFLRGSEDIETHILPLVLQTGDWERFLRYSSLAINLRRISDDLAEPDLLPALARHGHRQMALDATARVSDPAQRALGRAILAHSLDPGETDRKALVDLVREDLARLAPIDNPEEAQARALALLQIGLRLGPEILPSLERIPPPPEGQEPRPGWLAMSAAASALRRNGGLDAEAWRILRDLREEQVLAQFLPDLLGEAAANAEPARLLENLASLSLGPETLWACRLSILARQAQTSPEEAVHCWRALPADPPLPWSVDLIERGAPLFAHSTDLEIENPVARAALRVVILEHRPNAASEVAAREALERLPPGPERLHWSLRRVAASSMPEEIRRNEIRAIGRWLFKQQYRASFDDLRRYLELVARCLPEELQRRAEDVLLSPSGGVPLLFHLAETCGSRAVLEHLFEQVETYLSAVVGLPELEGLRFWRELIPQLTGRLCVLQRDLVALDQAAEKLGEMDHLAARVTGALASAECMDLASQACARIRLGRLRLTTRLRWLPETVISSGDLEPEPLYKAMASVAPLEDEWLGLAALHDPDPPEILFQRYLDRVGDRDTQVIALFRLARRALDHPGTTREKKRLVLQMLGQALSAMQSVERLVALTPLLPELVARVDPGRAVEEYREAFARLLELHTVPWTIRRDALERLLVQLASNPIIRKSESPRWARDTCALFAELEHLLAESIPGHEESAAADLLPVLTAARERLPAEVTLHLERPFGRRLQFAEPESEQIRVLCQTSLAERIQALETFGAVGISLRMIQALAFLLLRDGPGNVLALIDRCPSGSQRDDLCRRLVMHGWTTGQAAGDLVQRIDDSSLRLEASIWTSRASCDTTQWMASFASLAAESGIDPSDPVWTPLIQDLWSSEPESRRQVLAEAVLTALGQEEPRTAESALRLWMHAHLSPQDQGAGLCDKALDAIRTSLSLSPAPEVA